MSDDPYGIYSINAFTFESYCRTTPTPGLVLYE